jgi:small-conductance mechanosensitive channel
MKSTRIQLLQGEELIISNRDLTTKAIRNFKKMRKRRINFQFGVTYDTPSVKLKKIPEIIRSIIDPKNIKYVDKLDRVHFIEFGDFSLKFEVVYYLKTQDYMMYMDAQEAINFQIRDLFEKEGIQMAFPTQTIFLAKENK